MKPRTKLQKQVFELCESLPKITKPQKHWGLKNCLDHKGYRNKQGITCLDCGCKWQLKSMPNKTVCPNCTTRINVEDTLKRKDEQRAYYGIATTLKGFQVLRFFELYGYYKVAEKARFFCWEIAQHWILPNGKYEIIARKHTLNWYVDSWNGDMEIRSRSMFAKYDINPCKIFPRGRYISEIKRNGFKSEFHGVSPTSLFRAILTNSKAETLLKTRQFSLLEKHVSDTHKIETYWQSIKICIRNNYIISDASDWFDYIENLIYFGKDIRNAKYVCPSDFMSEHDRWMNKKRDQLERERIDCLKKGAIKDEDDYINAKNKFFDIEFTDELIQVKVLKSVTEIMEEGDALHHCVFTSGYHKRDDSLILSATIGKERIETVEVSLESLSILQCRGAFNKNTEHHDRIVRLINKNMHLINKRLSS